MSNALIALNETKEFITGYDMEFTPPKAIIQVMGLRVVDVCAEIYPIEEPLFWVTCPNESTIDNSYYDETARLVKLLPDLPPFPDIAPVTI